jgi:hypothetical protein
MSMTPAPRRRSFAPARELISFRLFLTGINAQSVFIPAATLAYDQSPIDSPSDIAQDAAF